MVCGKVNQETTKVVRWGLKPVPLQGGLADLQLDKRKCPD